MGSPKPFRQSSGLGGSLLEQPPYPPPPHPHLPRPPSSFLLSLRDAEEGV